MSHDQYRGFAPTFQEQIQPLAKLHPAPLNDNPRKGARKRATADGRKSGGKRLRPLDVTCLANVKPQKVNWLWKNYLPRGAAVILAGSPNQGKSNIYDNWTATISTGGVWPDGSRARKGSVIIVTNEDAREFVIVPRLLANGADLSKVYIMDSSLDLTKDVASLEAFIDQLGDVAMVVFDPIISYTGAGYKENSNAATRQVLDPMSAMAERTGILLVYVSHIVKDAGDKSDMARVLGSTGLVGVVRGVFFVATTPDGTKVFRHVKNNMGPMGRSISFTLEDETVHTDDGPMVTCRVVWGDVVDDGGHAKVKKKDCAEAFLRTALADGNWHKTKPLYVAAEAAGFSPRTIDRAKSDLGVRSRKAGTFDDCWWECSLPKDATKDAKK